MKIQKSHVHVCRCSLLMADDGSEVAPGWSHYGILLKGERIRRKRKSIEEESKEGEGRLPGVTGTLNRVGRVFHYTSSRNEVDA